MTKFVVRFGLSLHNCGATSSRIEKNLTKLCELLEIHGEFLSSQTSFVFVFWEDDPSEQRVIVKRVHPCGGDLGLLARLDSLVERFERRQLDFEQMSERLDIELEQPPYYGRFIRSLAWATSSFSFSILLSKSGYDAIISASISFLLFYIIDACAKHPRFKNLDEIIAPGIAGIILIGCAALGLPINVPLCILSSIIIFIPGLATVVALSEIANRDLTSGTARFVDALMSLIKLYLGAIIGVGVGSYLFGILDIDTFRDIHTFPAWFIPVAVVLLSGAMTVAFNIHRKFLLYCLASSFTAYIVSSLGQAYFSEVAGVLLGAFAVGIFSNAFANIYNYPASLVLTSGIILLVPGSKVYMILNSWITGKQIIPAPTDATQAFLTFISLVGGLLLSNAILPARKSL